MLPTSLTKSMLEPYHNWNLQWDVGFYDLYTESMLARNNTGLFYLQTKSILPGVLSPMQMTTWHHNMARIRVQVCDLTP